MVVLILARRSLKELSDYWTNLRTGKVILVLVVYSFGGAAVFHFVEMKTTTTEELQFGTGCLARYNDYWASLNYVNTLYTTMGYGSVYCCSWLGRLLTCIYILIGTPILLIVLEALGKVLARLCTQMWTFGGRFVDHVTMFIKRIARIIARKKLPSSIVESVEDGKKKTETKKGENDDEDEMIPLSAGLGLLIVWSLSTGLYFHYLEGWTYGSSIYYLFVSVTTVGLGDFAPTRYEYTILNYTLLLIGLALMSMCIAILQHKIETMVKRIQADMQRRRNSQSAGTEAASETEKHSDGLLGKLGIKPEEQILKMMMTSNQRDVVEGNDKKSQCQNARTQTRTPATVTTVKLCDRHRHYVEVSGTGGSGSGGGTVINEGDEIMLTDSSGKKSFKNQFARIANEAIFTIAYGSLLESVSSDECVICRALEDEKPPTPPPRTPTPPPRTPTPPPKSPTPPPPPRTPTPQPQPKWRM